LANFYHYLDHNLKEEMTKPNFKKHLNGKSLSGAELQPQFERLLKPLKQPLEVNSLQGKVLLNFDYLRFTQNNYNIFDPKRTVVLARWKKNNYLGIPAHCINDYKVEVKESVNELVERAKVIFSSVNNHLVFSNQYFFDTFINTIPQMLEKIAAVNRYLKENPVSCVIVGTIEDLASRILTIVAAGKGIPSICMQHGILGGEEAFMPVFTTKVAVYGQYEKNWYLEKGLSEERIAITGHPRFDDIFTQRHMSKAEFQEKYKVDQQNAVILFATQPYNVLLWNELIEITAQKPQIDIMIKPHPWELSRRELIDNYINLARKYKSVKLILEREANIYDILHNVDVVVINSSTVGLEAVLSDKLLCILSDNSFNYYEKMGEFMSSRPAELAEIISKLIEDFQMQKIAKNKRDEFLVYAYPQKLSGVRLLEEIDKLTMQRAANIEKQ
jgi:hypothetical protein